MNKREELLKSSLKLFVEQGFHDTPTSKIAKDAGVATGTLFHYYATKDELILALYKFISLKYSEYVDSNLDKDQSIEETLKSFFQLSIQWNQENKLDFSFLQQFQASPYVLLITDNDLLNKDKPLLDLIRSGLKSNDLRLLPDDLIYNLINSHIIGINAYLNSTNNNKNIEAITNTSIDLLWNMITNS